MNRQNTLYSKSNLVQGHAVMQSADSLATFDGTVMVLCGDTPLLRGESLLKFYQAHRISGAAATVFTARMPDPQGYGRVIRNTEGQVVKIVEQKECDV